MYIIKLNKPKDTLNNKINLKQEGMSKVGQPWRCYKKELIQ